MSSNPTPQDTPKTHAAPNVFCSHSVTLSVPIKDVYKTLGTTAGHERVCRLSKLCSKFELHQQDIVAVPPDTKRMADGVRIRELEPEQAGVESGNRQEITRHHFLMEETLPFLFGAYKKVVTLKGTLSWNDAEAKRLNDKGQEFDVAAASKDGRFEALYETVSGEGIVVWKHRRFEVVEGEPGKTKVSERLEIAAPSWMKPIVQWQADKGHKAHMDQYHTLF
ncbi:hypothetical protein CPB83DRAFT_412804 [Crepidotus variabilis]|uniref:Uncharacterized protein n=1 Tax=Crepidotus variabilis TaxID=179855 RepID=A0A9P6JUW3_9AGAR|nr:hypothetical protein CPB83DRAFT_412804 [Crepidotus variabilis]